MAGSPSPSWIASCTSERKKSMSKGFKKAQFFCEPQASNEKSTPFKRMHQTVFSWEHNTDSNKEQPAKLVRLQHTRDRKHPPNFPYKCSVVNEEALMGSPRTLRRSTQCTSFWTYGNLGPYSEIITDWEVGKHCVSFTSALQPDWVGCGWQWRIDSWTATGKNEYF